MFHYIGTRSFSGLQLPPRQSALVFRQRGAPARGSIPLGATAVVEVGRVGATPVLAGEWYAIIRGRVLERITDENALLCRILMYNKLFSSMPLLVATLTLAAVPASAGIILYTSQTAYAAALASGTTTGSVDHVFERVGQLLP